MRGVGPIHRAQRDQGGDLGADPLAPGGGQVQALAGRPQQPATVRGGPAQRARGPLGEPVDRQVRAAEDRPRLGHPFVPSMQVRIGLSAPSDARRIAVAMSVALVTNGGTYITSNASNAGSASSLRMVSSYCAGVAPAIMSIGLRNAASAGNTCRSGTHGLVAQHRQRQPTALAGVGRHDRGATRVGHDRGPDFARGRRLIGQQRRHVEELLDRVGPDHARLAQQRVHRRGPSSASAPVCDPAARAPATDRPLLTATIGLVRDTRPRDVHEAPRISEALEVEQDDPGPGVLLPVLDQVVPRGRRARFPTLTNWLMPMPSERA